MAFIGLGDFLRLLPPAAAAESDRGGAGRSLTLGTFVDKWPLRFILVVRVLQATVELLQWKEALSKMTEL